MLTSGTTGPPKRVDLSYEMLVRALAGAKHYESKRDAELRLRAGVAIINSPLVHVAGLFRVLQCVSDGRSFALLERFTVDGWVDAVFAGIAPRRRASCPRPSGWSSRPMSPLRT
jgi:acyl-CoA synthetase (AMP-forming)/AMP-acid ligase II